MPGGWSDDDDAPSPELVGANVRRQARLVVRLVRISTRVDEPFTVTPALLCGLHRVAMEGILPSAGRYRPDGEAYVGGHVPPSFDQVPGLVEEMCNYISEHWQASGPVQLAAYALWRTCWIHPFVDGNGRTARAFSYLVLSTRSGFVLPGRHPIPDRIKQSRANMKEYYAALGAADAAWRRGVLDVHVLASVLSRHFIDQVTG